MVDQARKWMLVAVLLPPMLMLLLLLQQLSAAICCTAASAHPMPGKRLLAAAQRHGEERATAWANAWNSHLTAPCPSSRNQRSRGCPHPWWGSSLSW